MEDVGSIIEFSALEFIGHEFLGLDIEKEVTTSSTTASFPKLVILSLRRLYELKEWEDITLEEEQDTSVNYMPNFKYLGIAKCPSLEVLPHRLFHKASLLHDLTIEEDERRLLKSSPTSFESVFGPLVTAIMKLRYFRLHECMDTNLPLWVTCLNYLTDLELYNSKNVTSLPPLGKLPCLQRLVIDNFSVIKLVGREFLGLEDDNNHENIISISIITSFPKLEMLDIRNCEQLEVWEDIKLAEDSDAITLMPNPFHLQIYNCPKLEVLPHRLLRRASSLWFLNISDCGITREEIVEDSELLLPLETAYVNNENLIQNSEREDNSEKSERSPSTSMRCCGRITLP